MANTRVILAIVTAGLLAGGVLSGCAKTESPGGEASVAEDISVAVGTGEFTDVKGDDDPATNTIVCIASVASDATDVVAGGAGATVEDAKLDAIKKAEDNKTPLGPDAFVVISACP